MENYVELFQSNYDRLNAKQKEAVDTIDGPLLVIAGPGSGKTELLSMRVANILLKTDVSPSNILCLTFTDSATLNMRQRLAKMIGGAAYKVSIHTFHNFGTDIIGRYPEYFYNGATFSPADELVQIEILEKIFDQLAYDNPLKVSFADHGYSYLYPAKFAIGKIKQAGLTPKEFKQIILQNQKDFEVFKEDISRLFDQTISSKLIPQLQDFMNKLKQHRSDFPVENINPYLPTFAESMERAFRLSLDLGKTAPLAEWKRKWISIDNNKKKILKDAKYTQHMLGLADIYAQYQDSMHRLKYFDFDDMLLSTLQVINENEDIKYDLQEQYQYILVDEFQDTNDAQMRLLHMLTDNPVNEDRPNIMVVGDDDQAIFKFQGAEISNILNFRRHYRDPKITTMTENYRSTQDILNVARNIILKGQERLENLFEEVEKDLVARNTSLDSGYIKSYSFETRANEYYFIAQEVSRCIKQGTPPSEIAIIARQHKDLEALVPFLHNNQIPIKYERQQNVLKEPHIRQLIHMSRFIVSLCRKNREEADELLPEILSYPFWGLSRTEIWKVSRRAYDERRLWIDIMLESEDGRIRKIADFFQELASKSHNEPLEYMLEILIGGEKQILANSEDEDQDDEFLPLFSVSYDTVYQSPFKNHYFHPNHFENHKLQYLSFLSSLKVFIRALREYKPNEMLVLEDLVTFVDIHEKNNLPVTDTSPFINSTNAVQLMSVHKSKGMEFDTVFVVSCQEEIWANNRFGSRLPFPMNLPIESSGDNTDDQLRLFYVALTRAKRCLYLTSYENDDGGNETLRLEFISEIEPSREASVRKDLLETIQVLNNSYSNVHKPPLIHEERALLNPYLEEYKLSVTHLNNFLNVMTGGPSTFLEQNLLMFPQPRTPAAAFGTAVHKTIQLIYLDLKKNGQAPTLEQVLHWFEIELLANRLSSTDHKNFLDKGNDALTRYYQQKRDMLDNSHIIERNFDMQAVYIDNAHIVGKIDKIIKQGDSEFVVYDFKTGKASYDWNGKSDYEKVKLYNYRRQLMFYKLLVENSREYGNKIKVNRGVLEFVEPMNDRIIELNLAISNSEVENLKKLIKVVYTKIVNFDFPHVDKYPKNLKGIKEFEWDLLNAQ